MSSPEASPVPSPSPQRTLVMRGPSKRKRTHTSNSIEPSTHRRRTREPESDDDDDDNDDGDGSDDYDPDQPMDERRKVQRGFRELLRDVTENIDEYMRPDSMRIQQTLHRADRLTEQVRQTSEATIDSRLLVTTADLANRKAMRMTQGNSARGIDVDEFVSKCITYMRRGTREEENDNVAGLSSMQRRRRAGPDAGGGGGGGGGEYGDEDGDEGDMYNWAYLGHHACLPSLRRPALLGFLIGPMSVEKKIRKITKRAAPFRPSNLEETRPEVLRVEDLAKKQNDLASVCAKILQRLMELQENIQHELANTITDDMDEAGSERLMHGHGLRSTGGVDLMRFVTNPRSFGQTVENMFYVTFLIRDGKVTVELDEHGIPSLAPVSGDEEEGGARRSGSTKHQAILSIDVGIWRDIVETYHIDTPMIEHRHEPTTNEGPGARGWYS